MTKLCTKCNKQTEFKETIGNNKYTCTDCGNTMYPCANKDCNYMISSWLYCDKCWNSGLKKFGLGVATVVSVPVIVLAALAGGGKGKR